MKYIKSFVIISILFFTCIINCYAEEEIPKVDSNNNSNTILDENNIPSTTTPQIDVTLKLYDLGDVYTAKQEKKLVKKIKKFEKTTGMDSIVVTTKKLDGKLIGEYTTLFYETNGFNKNTVIFVIYINDVEDEIYMYSVGEKTTSYYTDERTGEILKYVYSYVSKKDYYTATDKYLTIIQGFYDKDNSLGNYKLNEDGNIVKIIPWLEIIILAMAITFMLFMLFLYRIKAINKLDKVNQLDKELNSTNMVVLTVKDELIDTVVSK